MNYRKKQIVDSLTSTSSSGSLISNGTGALSSPNREGKQRTKPQRKKESLLACALSISKRTAAQKTCNKKEKVAASRFEEKDIRVFRIQLLA